MKYIRSAAVLMPVLALSSCLSMFAGGAYGKVMRWAHSAAEIKEAVYPVNEGDNIFADFIWTNPDIKSRELVFADSECLVEIAGVQYRILLNADSLEITNTADNSVQTLLPQVSGNDCYYDLHRLGLATSVHHRWVPVTTTTIQNVPVQMTRQVPMTTVGANGMVTTTYRTEFYTVWQTRTVPHTTWVWESHSVSVLDVPSYTYYKFISGSGDTFFIYKEDSGSSAEYFLQNVSYRYLTAEAGSIFGESEIKILFADADANGSCFDPEDIVLFNSWNPFERSSKFIPVSGLIGNKWFKARFIEKNKLVSFSYDSAADKLSITNLNAEYTGNTKTGKIVINNLDNPRAMLYINGNPYVTSTLFGKLKTEFSCEYGKYILKLVNPGYDDFETSFEINGDNKKVIIDYKQPLDDSYMTEDITRSLHEEYAGLFR